MRPQKTSADNGTRFFIIISGLVIIILATVIYAVTNYTVFQVKDITTSKIIFEKRIKIGTDFTLSYIHSVTNRPVYEVFTIHDKNTLALREMRFDSFGANLPAGPEQFNDQTTYFTIKDGYYKVTYTDHTFDEISLRVGKIIPNHTLIFADGTKLRFLDLVAGGTHVEFYVQSLLE